MSEETVNQKVTDAIAPHTKPCARCGKPVPEGGRALCRACIGGVSMECPKCRLESGVYSKEGGGIGCTHCDKQEANEKARKAHDIIHSSEAPFGYCPVCGAKGVRREKRPYGDDMCAAGHTYPSEAALDVKPDPDEPMLMNIQKQRRAPSIYTQPCKSCGKDNAVREFGLMCESCQRETKFTVSGKALTEHLAKAREQDQAHTSEIHKENERIFERNQLAQAEHDKRHWVQVRLHQAEVDAHGEMVMNEREKLADARLARANEANDERARRDQLQRLYVAYMSNLLRVHESRESDPSDLVYALESARKAQKFFEREYPPMRTLTVPKLSYVYEEPLTKLTEEEAAAIRPGYEKED